MWLSAERSRRAAEEAAAEWGPVTISEPAAVYLAGERRQVPLCCPGGYAWRPAVGEDVLVLKAGSQGEQPYILGATGAVSEELEPGQVRIRGQACGLLLGEELELTGTVRVNGEKVEELVRRVVRQLLFQSGEQEEGT